MNAQDVNHLQALFDKSERALAFLRGAEEHAKEFNYDEANARSVRVAFFEQLKAAAPDLLALAAYACDDGEE